MLKLKEKKKREEFTLAYNKYYPLLFDIIYSRVGNQHDASDICQEIFIIFFKKFDQVENHKKWLLGTMRNLILQYYKKKVNADINIDEIFDDVNLAFVNGFREARIIVNEAIEKVDLNEEEILLIDYIAYNRYSYSYVCQAMGLTMKQVRVRYAKAVRKVMNYLKDNGIHNIEDIL